MTSAGALPQTVQNRWRRRLRSQTSVEHELCEACRSLVCLCRNPEVGNAENATNCKFREHEEYTVAEDGETPDTEKTRHKEHRDGDFTITSASSQSRDGPRWRRNHDLGILKNERMQGIDVFQNARLGIEGEEDVIARVIEGMCPQSKLSLLSPMRQLQAPELARDFASVLQGGAHHLKGILGRIDEQSLFNKLRVEIEESGMWRSRGLDKYEQTIAPDGGQRSTGRITGPDAITLAKLPAHRYVLEHLAGLFDAKPLSWWINVYPSGKDAKNFHKDNFGQNITIGASFGATRNLTFRHGETRDEFHFPQSNGDVFAFRDGVNNAFLHGMHPLKAATPDPCVRISVIMMGRSRGGH